MPDPNIKILHKKTLLQMIENAPGTNLFRSLFVEYQNNKEIKDVCNNGEYSCAFFVSSLLTLTSYIPKPHATVKSLRTTLLSVPFITIDSLVDAKPGDIIFWDKIEFLNGLTNEHVGFVNTAGKAISTSYKKQMVVEHDLMLPAGTGSEERKVTLLLRTPY